MTTVHLAMQLDKLLCEIIPINSPWNSGTKNSIVYISYTYILYFTPAVLLYFALHNFPTIVGNINGILISLNSVIHVCEIYFNVYFYTFSKENFQALIESFRVNDQQLMEIFETFATEEISVNSLNDVFIITANLVMLILRILVPVYFVNLYVLIATIRYLIELTVSNQWLLHMHRVATDLVKVGRLLKTADSSCNRCHRHRRGPLCLQISCRKLSPYQ